MANDVPRACEQEMAAVIARLQAEVERLREAAWSRSLIDVAKGILVGRLGCAVDEAFEHLLELSETSGEGLIGVSASLVDMSAGIEPIGSKPTPAAPSGERRPAPLPGGRPSGERTSGDRPGGQYRGLSGERGAAPRVPAPRSGQTATSRHEAHPAPVAISASPETVTVVQTVLNMLPAPAALLAPVRDSAGEVVDYWIRAATPTTRDPYGRSHADAIGRRLSATCPTLAEDPERWRRYLGILGAGVVAEYGPVEYEVRRAGVPPLLRFAVKVCPLGEALLVFWNRTDQDEEQARRRAKVESLANVGWGAWHYPTQQATWSDQMYRMYGQDPGGRPLSLDSFEALVHPDDLSALEALYEALLKHGGPFEVEYRIIVDGQIRHHRAVAEVTFDASGSPLELFGIVQDVSATRRTHDRLEVIRRELKAHQQLLAEEQRLAVQLQRIILPVPDAPVRLPGMRVAVRYLPAETLARVGGDWFQANPLPDGALLLAVGDVTGHGLPAAATMAQLRHALAGLALITRNPAEILAALNTLLYEQPDDTLLATAVVARYQPRDRTLTWAQAGHPPAVLARPAATSPVRLLDRPEGVSLGALRDSRYDQSTVVLDPGDLLLMYTDGLVESPGGSIDEGVSALMSTVAASLRATGDPLTSITRSLRRANPGDDTCIVAAQLIDA